MGAREPRILGLSCPKKSNKRKDPSLRNFFAIAKTVLYVPRRYRSCPSERPAPILNRGNFEFV